MAAPNIHLEIPEITGDSVVGDHEGQIDCTSWSWGVSQSCNMHKSTGGTEAASHVSDVVVTKKIDKASPNLFLDSTTGRHFPAITLHCTKSAGDAGRMEWYTIEMERCVISSVSPSVDQSGEGYESVSIHFGKYNAIYTEQNEDGSAGTENPKGMDIANPMA
jgi:type VI secretion system secreted protein Hcp